MGAERIQELVLFPGLDVRPASAQAVVTGDVFSVGSVYLGGLLNSADFEICGAAARQEYGALMAEMPEHTFLPAFERKMRRLLRRANHPLRRRIIQTAACLLLAAAGASDFISARASRYA